MLTRARQLKADKMHYRGIPEPSCGEFTPVLRSDSQENRTPKTNRVEPAYMDMNSVLRLQIPPPKLRSQYRNWGGLSPLPQEQTSPLYSKLDPSTFGDAYSDCTSSPSPQASDLESAATTPDHPQVNDTPLTKTSSQPYVVISTHNTPLTARASPRLLRRNIATSHFLSPLGPAARIAPIARPKMNTPPVEPKPVSQRPPMPSPPLPGARSRPACQSQGVEKPSCIAKRRPLRSIQPTANRRIVAANVSPFPIKPKVGPRKNHLAVNVIREARQLGQAARHPLPKRGPEQGCLGGGRQLFMKQNASPVVFQYLDV